MLLPLFIIRKDSFSKSVILILFASLERCLSFSISSLLSENLENLEAERTALKSEKEKFEEEVKAFQTEKEDFKKEKSQLEEEISALDNERKEANRKSWEEKSGLQTRIMELQDAERRLMQRENDLNERIRDFNMQQLQMPYNPHAYPNVDPYSAAAMAAACRLRWSAWNTI